MVLRLKDVCDKASSNIAQKDVTDIDGIYPIYGASGFIKNVNFYRQEKEYIGVVKDGAGVGRAMLLPPQSSVIGTVQYILPKKDVSVKYLYYILAAMNLAKYATGATIPHIYFRDYSKEKVFVPSIEKQERVATTLDKASELISLRKKQLEELDALAESVFYDMFGDPVKNEKGWEEGKIEEVCNSVNYGTSSPANEGGKYKYIRMNNITYQGDLDLTDLKYIDISDKDYEKYVVRKGDILFNRTNSKELVGKTTYIQVDEEAIIAGYIIRVRLNSTVLPVFVSKYMNTKYIKLYLRGLCKSIIGQANINAKELQSIPIYLPPLPLQTQFATIIEKIESQKALAKQALQESEYLFQRLMQDLFNPD
jgi:type I restriction enzyme S subunit